MRWIELLLGSYQIGILGGFIYGYVTYGTPFLPRRSIATFLQIAGTSMFVRALIRNAGDASAPIARLLPTILWNVSIVFGAILRSWIDARFTWRDLFDVEEIEDDSIANRSVTVEK